MRVPFALSLVCRVFLVGWNRTAICPHQLVHHATGAECRDRLSLTTMRNVDNPTPSTPLLRKMQPEEVAAFSPEVPVSSPQACLAWTFPQ